MKNLTLTKSTSLLVISFIVTACHHSDIKPQTQKTQSPYTIIDDSPASHWRDINIENTLYITLESGEVIVELAPQFAPNHVANTKKLVQEGVFDGTSFYRVVDGFVAQGGPVVDDDTVIGKPKNGKLTIPAEFTIKTDKPIDMTYLNAIDGYADEVGYFQGFAMGRNKDKTNNWLLHCYGALAMGRANDVDTGGTELYIVIGQAQRYLDRNTTVFGRVVAGMEHIQALKRSSNLSGTIDMKGKNKILSIKLASEIANDKRLPLQIMRTNSDSFKAIIESRKNRNGQWFVYQHNYIDVCSVAVPVRLKNSTAKAFK